MRVADSVKLSKQCNTDECQRALCLYNGAVVRDVQLKLQPEAQLLNLGKRDGQLPYLIFLDPLLEAFGIVAEANVRTCTNFLTR